MSDGVGEAAESDPGDELVTIRIVGLPMPVYLRASEHGDELMREFALMSAGDGGAQTKPMADADVPLRLTALVDDLRARFAGFTLAPESELAQAAARGDATIDVAYTVPPGIAQAVAALESLLEEADEFCRAGDLLTLATPPEAVSFRRWFLGEFVRQADGRAPTSWSDWKQ